MRVTEEQFAGMQHRDLTRTSPTASPHRAKRPGPRMTPREKNERGMNKLETRYANEVLEPLKRMGKILDYKFEKIKLKLADLTYYTPDFQVIYPDHIALHETKGHWEDDARVKIKVAADQFPEYEFTAVQYKKKIWIYENF